MRMRSSKYRYRSPPTPPCRHEHPGHDQNIDVGSGSPCCKLQPKSCRVTESENGRGWKGPLWVTQSNPWPKQGHPEQAAQDRVQVGLEYLQRRRISSPEKENKAKWGSEIGKLKRKLLLALFLVLGIGLVELAQNSSSCCGSPVSLCPCTGFPAPCTPAFTPLESQNHEDWKRPQRSSSPTANPSPHAC